MKKLKNLASFIILIVLTAIIAIIYNQNLILADNIKTEAWEAGN